MTRVLKRKVPYSWQGAILQIISVGTISFTCTTLRDPGIAVTILGFAAVILVFRGPRFTRIEEVIWILIALMLCILEISSIKNDRREQNARHDSELYAQQYRFFESIRHFLRIETDLSNLQTESISLQEKVDRVRKANTARTPTLKEKALEMAKEINDFFLLRKESAPRPPERFVVRDGKSYPVDAAVYAAARANYEQASDRFWDDAQADWDTRFRARVSEVMDELKKQGVMPIIPGTLTSCEIQVRSAVLGHIYCSETMAEIAEKLE